jgi:hypothetical protein
MYPPSGEARETSTLLGTLKRVNLNHITAAIQARDTRMSQIDIATKYAVKIVVEHVQSGTVRQLEVIFFSPKNPTNKPSP